MHIYLFAGVLFTKQVGMRDERYTLGTLYVLHAGFQTLKGKICRVLIQLGRVPTVCIY